MRQLSLIVPRTARYCVLGDLSPETETIWFVCHGYGQLTPYFIRNFEVLNDGKQVVVAPEALSRFYLNGTSGRVGASWMTSENRKTEIQDYISFLNLLAAGLLQNAPPGIKINLLGFSQGAATVCRWLPASGLTVDKLILWAGVFPPDMDIDHGLSAKKVLLVYGDQDEYITPHRLLQSQEFIQHNNLQPELVPFSGGHQIDKETLLKIADLS